MFLGFISKNFPTLESFISRPVYEIEVSGCLPHRMVDGGSQLTWRPEHGILRRDRILEDPLSSNPP